MGGGTPGRQEPEVPGHRFRFEERHRLDAPERLERQPPTPLVELIASAPAGPILDLGSGTGYLSIPLASAQPDRLVAAVDAVPAMSALLARRASTADIRSIGSVMAHAGGDTSLPFTDGSFAAAISVNLLHELPDLRSALEELERILAPDGLLLLCDWSPDGDPVSGPRPSHRVPPERIEEHLATRRWRNIRRPDLYRDHWVVTARHPGPRT